MANGLELKRFLFGGDYCPEQWPESVWEEDIRLMKKLGVNAVTINVHSWAFDEPEEGRYDFSWLDKVVSMLKDAGIGIIMATGTTSAPAWLYQKDHGSMKTDIKGRALKHGVRERFCPTSPSYRKAVRGIVSALAEHYKDESDIVLWHLNNELSGFCYCENCEKEFRKWLGKKYGTIGNLNERWCSAMWGRHYFSFDDIMAPTELNELYVNVNNQGFNLDSLPTEAIEYARFMSDMHAQLFAIESECIKNAIPDAVCTNNYQFRDRFNYHRIAEALDTIALDIYPNRGDASSEAAFNLDIARNFKTQDTPFMIMEMTPNHASWSSICCAKRPGEIARIAINNIAHGANSALYFQIRRTPAGFEKFHGAMISHSGHLDTRIARELKALSDDLGKLPLDLMKESLHAEVAVIHDWDEKLGVEVPCTVQKNIDYGKEVKYYYRYFHDRNINVDVISLDQDFSKYKIIVAPMVCMIREEYAQNLQRFVENGGHLVLTYYSGYTDECDKVYLGGQPGPLRKTAGLWVEELDGVRPEDENELRFADGFSCKAGWMCDVIRPETAKTLACYTKQYYKDSPCVLRNRLGDGLCTYIGAKPDRDGLDYILDDVLSTTDVRPVMKTPALVRASRRGKYLFLINFAEDEQVVPLENEMENVLTGTKETQCRLGANGYAIYRI